MSAEFYRMITCMIDEVASTVHRKTVMIFEKWLWFLNSPAWERVEAGWMGADAGPLASVLPAFPPPPKTVGERESIYA